MFNAINYLTQSQKDKVIADLPALKSAYAKAKANGKHYQASLIKKTIDSTRAPTFEDAITYNLPQTQYDILPGNGFTVTQIKKPKLMEKKQNILHHKEKHYTGRYTSPKITKNIVTQTQPPENQVIPGRKMRKITVRTANRERAIIQRINNDTQNSYRDRLLSLVDDIAATVSDFDEEVKAGDYAIYPRAIYKRPLNNNTIDTACILAGISREQYDEISEPQNDLFDRALTLKGVSVVRYRNTILIDHYSECSYRAAQMINKLGFNFPKLTTPNRNNTASYDILKCCPTLFIDSKEISNIGKWLDDEGMSWAAVFVSYGPREGHTIIAINTSLPLNYTPENKTVMTYNYEGAYIFGSRYGPEEESKGDTFDPRNYVSTSNIPIVDALILNASNGVSHEEAVVALSFKKQLVQSPYPDYFILYLLKSRLPDSILRYIGSAITVFMPLMQEDKYNYINLVKSNTIAIEKGNLPKIATLLDIDIKPVQVVYKVKGEPPKGLDGKPYPFAHFGSQVYTVDWDDTELVAQSHGELNSKIVQRLVNKYGANLQMLQCVKLFPYDTYHLIDIEWASEQWLLLSVVTIKKKQIVRIRNYKHTSLTTSGLTLNFGKKQMTIADRTGLYDAISDGDLKNKILELNSTAMFAGKGVANDMILLSKLTGADVYIEELEKYGIFPSIDKLKPGNQHDPCMDLIHIQALLQMPSILTKYYKVPLTEEGLTDVTLFADIQQSRHLFSNPNIAGYIEKYADKLVNLAGMDIINKKFSLLDITPSNRHKLGGRKGQQRGNRFKQYNRNDFRDDKVEYKAKNPDTIIDANGKAVGQKVRPYKQPGDQEAPPPKNPGNMHWTKDNPNPNYKGKNFDPNYRNPGRKYYPDERQLEYDDYDMHDEDEREWPALENRFPVKYIHKRAQPKRAHSEEEASDNVVESDYEEEKKEDVNPPKKDKSQIKYTLKKTATISTKTSALMAAYEQKQFNKLFYANHSVVEVKRYGATFRHRLDANSDITFMDYGNKDNLCYLYPIIDRLTKIFPIHASKRACLITVLSEKGHRVTPLDMLTNIMSIAKDAALNHLLDNAKLTSIESLKDGCNIESVLPLYIYLGIIPVFSTLAAKRLQNQIPILLAGSIGLAPTKPSFVYIEFRAKDQVFHAWPECKTPFYGSILTVSDNLSAEFKAQLVEQFTIDNLDDVIMDIRMITLGSQPIFTSCEMIMLIQFEANVKFGVGYREDSGEIVKAINISPMWVLNKRAQRWDLISELATGIEYTQTIINIPYAKPMKVDPLDATAYSKVEVCPYVPKPRTIKDVSAKLAKYSIDCNNENATELLTDYQIGFVLEKYIVFTNTVYVNSKRIFPQVPRKNYQLDPKATTTVADLRGDITDSPDACTDIYIILNQTKQLELIDFHISFANAQLLFALIIDNECMSEPTILLKLTSSKKTLDTKYLVACMEIALMDTKWVPSLEESDNTPKLKFEKLEDDPLYRVGGKPVHNTKLTKLPAPIKYGKKLDEISAAHNMRSAHYPYLVDFCKLMGIVMPDAFKELEKPGKELKLAEHPHPYLRFVNDALLRRALQDGTQRVGPVNALYFDIGSKYRKLRAMLADNITIIASKPHIFSCDDIEGDTQDAINTCEEDGYTVYQMANGDVITTMAVSESFDIQLPVDVTLSIDSIYYPGVIEYLVSPQNNAKYVYVTFQAYTIPNKGVCYSGQYYCEEGIFKVYWDNDVPHVTALAEGNSEEYNHPVIICPNPNRMVPFNYKGLRFEPMVTIPTSPDSASVLARVKKCLPTAPEYTIEESINTYLKSSRASKIEAHVQLYINSSINDGQIKYDSIFSSVKDYIIKHKKTPLSVLDDIIIMKKLKETSERISTIQKDQLISNLNTENNTNISVTDIAPHNHIAIIEEYAKKIIDGEHATHTWYAKLLLRVRQCATRLVKYPKAISSMVIIANHALAPQIFRCVNKVYRYAMMPFKLTSIDETARNRALVYLGTLGIIAGSMYLLTGYKAKPIYVPLVKTRTQRMNPESVFTSTNWYSNKLSGSGFCECPTCSIRNKEYAELTEITTKRRTNTAYLFKQYRFKPWIYPDMKYRAMMLDTRQTQFDKLERYRYIFKHNFAAIIHKTGAMSATAKYIRERETMTIHMRCETLKRAIGNTGKRIINITSSTIENTAIITDVSRGLSKAIRKITVPNAVQNVIGKAKSKLFQSASTISSYVEAQIDNLADKADTAVDYMITARYRPEERPIYDSVCKPEYKTPQDKALAEFNTNYRPTGNNLNEEAKTYIKLKTSDPGFAAKCRLWCEIKNQITPTKVYKVAKVIQSVINRSNIQRSTAGINNMILNLGINTIHKKGSWYRNDYYKTDTYDINAHICKVIQRETNQLNLGRSSHKKYKVRPDDIRHCLLPETITQVPNDTSKVIWEPNRALKKFIGYTLDGHPMNITETRDYIEQLDITNRFKEQEIYNVGVKMPANFTHAAKYASTSAFNALTGFFLRPVGPRPPIDCYKRKLYLHHADVVVTDMIKRMKEEFPLMPRVTIEDYINTLPSAQAAEYRNGFKSLQRLKKWKLGYTMMVKTGEPQYSDIARSRFVQTPPKWAKPLLGWFNHIMIKLFKRVIPGFLHGLNNDQFEQFLGESILKIPNGKNICWDTDSFDATQWDFLIEAVDRRVFSAFIDDALATIPSKPHYYEIIKQHVDSLVYRVYFNYPEIGHGNKLMFYAEIQGTVGSGNFTNTTGGNTLREHVKAEVIRRVAKIAEEDMASNKAGDDSFVRVKDEEVESFKRTVAYFLGVRGSSAGSIGNVMKVIYEHEFHIDMLSKIGTTNGIKVDMIRQPHRFMFGGNNIQKHKLNNIKSVDDFNASITHGLKYQAHKIPQYEQYIEYREDMWGSSEVGYENLLKEKEFYHQDKIHRSYGDNEPNLLLASMPYNTPFYANNVQYYDRLLESAQIMNDITAEIRELADTADNMIHLTAGKLGRSNRSVIRGGNFDTTGLEVNGFNSRVTASIKQTFNNISNIMNPSENNNQSIITPEYIRTAVKDALAAQGVQAKKKRANTKIKKFKSTYGNKTVGALAQMLESRGEDQKELLGAIKDLKVALEPLYNIRPASMKPYGGDYALKQGDRNTAFAALNQIDADKLKIDPSKIGEELTKLEAQIAELGLAPISRSTLRYLIALDDWDESWETVKPLAAKYGDDYMRRFVNRVLKNQNKKSSVIGHIQTLQGGDEGYRTSDFSQNPVQPQISRIQYPLNANVGQLYDPYVYSFDSVSTNTFATILDPEHCTYRSTTKNPQKVAIASSTIEYVVTSNSSGNASILVTGGFSISDRTIFVNNNDAFNPVTGVNSVPSTIVPGPFYALLSTISRFRTGSMSVSIIPITSYNSAGSVQTAYWQARSITFSNESIGPTSFIIPASEYPQSPWYATGNNKVVYRNILIPGDGEGDTFFNKTWPAYSSDTMLYHPFTTLFTGFSPNTAIAKVVVTSVIDFIPVAAYTPVCPMTYPQQGPATAEFITNAFMSYPVLQSLTKKDAFELSSAMPKMPIKFKAAMKLLQELVTKITPRMTNTDALQIDVKINENENNQDVNQSGVLSFE